MDLYVTGHRRPSIWRVFTIISLLYDEPRISVIASIERSASVQLGY